jgi:hypothetical protein
VFLRAARHLPRLGEEPGAYLTVVAVNVCRDVLRQRGRAALSLDQAPSCAAKSDVEGAAVHSQVLAKVWRHLTPRERLVLTYELAGYSLKESAMRLGTSFDVAAKALSRARQRARHLAGNGLAAIPAVQRGWHAVRRTILRGLDAAASTTHAHDLGSLVVVTLIPVIAGIGAGSGSGADRSSPPAVSAATLVPPRAEVAGSGVSAAGAAALPQLGAGALSSRSVSAARPRSGAQTAPSYPPMTNTTGPWDTLHPQDTQITGFGASPHESTDGTIFASGSCGSGCGRLFETTDGGSTWQTRRSAGLISGTVLVSPNYPRTPTIFVLSANALQRSDDQGDTFVTVMGPPQASPAAIAVDPNSGETIVLVGEVPLLEYHAASGTVAPGPQLPAQITSIDSIGFLDGRHVLVVGRELAIPYAQILLCDLATQSCSTSATLSSPRGTTTLLVSPSVASDRTVLLVDGIGQFFASRDDGGTWQEEGRVPDPIRSVVLSPTFAQDGTVLVSADTIQTGEGRTYRSLDGASTFTSLGFAGAPTGAGAGALAWPDPARTLVAVQQSSVAITLGGLACSRDGGASFRASC